MTELTTKPKEGLLARLASDVGISPGDYYDTLCKTIMPGNKTAKKEEVIALCHVADQYSLNPWLKQIYAYPAKGGGITPVMGYDGWVSLATRNKNLDGVEFRYADDSSWVECIIHRKDQKVPTVVREYYDECKRNTDPWKNMPNRMLRNRAYCQAVRMAFGISGIMLDDEVEAWHEREVSVEVKDHPLQVQVEGRPQVTDITPTDPQPQAKDEDDPAQFLDEAELFGDAGEETQVEYD